MAQEELYINGKRIYLSDRTVARTLQINDFREVVDRQANYSNTIKIPRTPQNIKAFDFLGVEGNTSNISYEEISVKYVLDGIEMVVDGKGIIKSTGEFYDFNFYDGNVSLSDLLGNKTLSTLDYSAYNHNLTYGTFFNSFANTSGYIYGLTGSNFVDIGQTTPSFYIHTLIDMIFSEKGWVIEGAIFSDVDYLSRTTTMNLGFNQNLTPVLVNKYSQVNSDNHTDTYITETETEYLVDTYVAADSGIFNLEITGDIVVILGFVDLIEVRVNGVFKSSFLNSDTASVYADNGDVITTHIRATAEEVIQNVQYDIDVTENFTTNILLDNSYYQINFEDIIGSTRQIDLVKDVMQRFNLSFRKVRNENKLQFITSKALLTDKVNAENWSSKYSNKTKEVTKSTYAKKNDFKYLYDDSGNNFADGSMDLTDVNLAETKTLVTSLFKASQTINDVYTINLWQENEGVFEPTQDGLRIFKINLHSTQRSFRINDGDYFSKTGNVADLDFSTLSFQNEIDNNYTEFKDLIDKFKLTTIPLNLSVIDIYQLDFFKLKYFEQTGRFYYLNKVTNFKNNTLTKGELIEIPV